uniref:C-type lectin domain-containing protein n=1 Tax=Nothobranchius furzeri TaxID=105023 RepID=A0A8C6LR86_NOTFU
MAAGLLFVWFLCVLAVGAHCSLCPPGWTWYEGRCYLFVDSAKDWADAEKYCNLFGGNLASYHSEDDYNFIRHLIYRAAHSDRQSWVGGNDAVQDCTWFWSDGSNFDYTNWGRGEPDNRGGNQKCMDINKNGTRLYSRLRLCAAV